MTFDKLSQIGFGIFLIFILALGFGHLFYLPYFSYIGYSDFEFSRVLLFCTGLICLCFFCFYVLSFLKKLNDKIRRVGMILCSLVLLSFMMSAALKGAHVIPAYVIKSFNLGGGIPQTFKLNKNFCQFLNSINKTNLECQENKEYEGQMLLSMDEPYVSISGHAFILKKSFRAE